MSRPYFSLLFALRIARRRPISKSFPIMWGCMATPPVSDEDLATTVSTYNAMGRNQSETARVMGLARETVQSRLRRAAERGLMGTAAVLPGFKITKVTNTPHGDTIQQKPDLGVTYKPVDNLALKGRTTWAEVLPDGTRIATREVLMERPDAAAQLAAMRAAVEGFKDEIPRADAVVPVPLWTSSDLLCQYTITDVHLGCLAWHEETGNDDYDLTIAEKLLEDWFAAAIDMAPRAQTAIFAQIGDFLHHDSHESVTPAHHNVLDADSRFQKMVRAAIRLKRKIVARLLTKHEFVYLIDADANHDPASGTWLREMEAAHYENESRVFVDQSAGTYYVHKHGDVSLFFHHGHKRGVKDVDTVFAGRFREIYGSTKFSYAHLGHRHNDELRTTNLMKVEQHETLAAPDAYAANKGYLSGRSAKVIVYHKSFGEVSRLVMTPQMVAGASERPIVANDNEPKERAA